MGTEVPLFAAGLLEEPRTVAGVVLRPLSTGDFGRGFCDVLSELTTCGATEEQFNVRFGEMQKACGSYYTVVGEDSKTGRVVASGSVVIERKFIHQCGLVGHIEDIVVSKCARGRHVGEALIAQLVHIARSVGCYKVILNCSEQARGFYEKCGFASKELEMVLYLDK